MLQRNEGHVACAAHIQGYLERDEDGRWRIPHTGTNPTATQGAPKQIPMEKAIEK